jgi:hypothetical protein
MAYDEKLVTKIRDYLLQFPKLEVEERKMFRGLTFMINGKMCISVSGQNLMCRFDPGLQEEVAEKNGFLPMKMKGNEIKGYCYVDPTGIISKKDFEYWINLCLNYNDRAKISRKKK